jgi:hypothetical protein
MANDIFHSHTSHHPADSTGDSVLVDFGQQMLSFIKMSIFFLVLLKIFQLAFLKYRRKLTLPERVERKYKYSHGEILERFSEGEEKLMKQTI